jgi:hypothetical protein
MGIPAIVCSEAHLVFNKGRRSREKLMKYVLWVAAAIVAFAVVELMLVYIRLL